MMGEVLKFRTKKLTGFIPDPQEQPAGPPPESHDPAPCEVNPDSGDCA